MLVTTQNLFKTLREYGLLTADEIAPFHQRKRKTRKRPKLESLVRELQQADLLTEYQANVIRRGNCGDLVVGDLVILDRLCEAAPLFRVCRRECRSSGIVFLRESVEANTKIEVPPYKPFLIPWQEAGGNESSQYWLMEDFDGQTLATVLAESGSFPINDAAQSVYEAALGLNQLLSLDFQPLGKIDTCTFVLDDDGVTKTMAALAIHRPRDLSDDVAIGDHQHAIRSIGILFRELAYGTDASEENMNAATTPDWAAELLTRIEGGVYQQLDQVIDDLGAVVGGKTSLPAIPEKETENVTAETTPPETNSDSVASSELDTVSDDAMTEQVMSNGTSNELVQDSVTAESNFSETKEVVGSDGVNSENNLLNARSAEAPNESDASSFSPWWIVGAIVVVGLISAAFYFSR